MQNKVDVLCLLETRVKMDKSEAILSSKFTNWNICSNYDHAINGKIWLLWRKGIDFTIIQVVDQCIIAKGKFQNKLIFISAIYGSNDGVHRHYITPDMKDFQDFTQDLALTDHPFFGPNIMWSNKQQDFYLARKFDRIMINPSWASAFQNSFVEFLAPGVSDHSMSWFHNIPGNPMTVLFLKLKRLKVCLKGFNKDNYSNLSDRVKLMRLELKNQQLLTLKGEEAIEKELGLQVQLKTLEDTESNLLKQKAKVHWIRDGDKNTKFFHSVVAFKNKRDTIRVLIDDNGNRLESFEAMSNEVISYFSKFLGTSDPSVKDIDPALFNNLLNFSMPVNAPYYFVKEVLDEEIKNAIFCQGNDKAPRLDGFTPYFFKISWDIVGKEVIEAVKYFFNNAYIHPAFN
ncbi:uncharacterized protein LOC120140934 [Hibiscus syriacus]|uniref:uncharacterized protein LOC120140934 n=1 Tax=Hibiscus syriacus TaxID=106335 RepID=UPI001921F2F0|nr:uncharacterized protein LOC120140934 [Hibiscus syriacus]